MWQYQTSSLTIDKMKSIFLRQQEINKKKVSESIGNGLDVILPLIHAKGVASFSRFPR